MTQREETASAQTASPSSPQPWGKRLGVFLLHEQEARRVRWFEVLFTLTFLLNMGRCLLGWPEWLTADGFHLNTLETRWLGYPPPMPLMTAGWQVLVFAGLIFSGGWMLILGKWRRLALLLLWSCAVYAQQVDVLSSHSLNKLYIAVYTLLLLGPGMWRDPTSGRLMQSVAMLRVLQASLILIYLAAGLVKVEGAWISNPDVLWSQVQGLYRTEITAWLLNLLPHGAWSAMQHFALAFELLAPLLFTVGRLRVFTLLFGLTFHLTIALLMKDLIYFSLQMAAFYALFIKKDEWLCFEHWLSRCVRRLTEEIGG